VTTPQLDFWRGDFGNLYIDRNKASADNLRALVALWVEIMAHTLPAPPQSILEVGANIGNNLRALRAITGARFYAVEPNEKARDILLRDQVVAPADLRDGFASSINFADGVADLAFTSGVLIHVHPDQLLASLKEIYRCSARWIVCIEYFSDKPEMIPFRGHDDRLFKRDFRRLLARQFQRFTDGSLWLRLEARH
jgi:pseudaminic acid biosynthesis-associated methylase